jgi:CubicO group peptidase (beta-lactamase class C family)
VEMVDGSTHPSFAPLASALKRQLRRTSGGAAVCVYQKGRCVVDIWGGNKDSSGTPWDRDTMSVSFSTTKGVASTALHLVADRGLIDYDKPVATYWPEFAQAGKENISVRQVLCHQSGLHDIRNIVDNADRLLDWEHMTNALAAAAPDDLPRIGSAYHAMTYGWLVGEVIRRVTGKSFPEFVKTEIADPLEMDGFYVGAPPDQLHRAARLIDTISAPLSTRTSRRDRRMRIRMEGALRMAGVPVNITKLRDSLAPPGVTDFDFSSDKVLSAAIPSANGLFTARSLARMYAALAGGGELDGVRLLSPETLARATRVHVRGRDHHLLMPMGWRLGYHQVFTTRGVPKRAFGHYGFGGSGAWADPERDLSFAMTLNDGIGSPLTASWRTMRMSAIALSCAHEYSKKPRADLSLAAA